MYHKVICFDWFKHARDEAFLIGSFFIREITLQLFVVTLVCVEPCPTVTLLSLILDAFIVLSKKMDNLGFMASR